MAKNDIIVHSQRHRVSNVTYNKWRKFTHINTVSLIRTTRVHVSEQHYTVVKW